MNSVSSDFKDFVEMMLNEMVKAFELFRKSYAQRVLEFETQRALVSEAFNAKQHENVKQWVKQNLRTPVNRNALLTQETEQTYVGVIDDDDEQYFKMLLDKEEF